MPSSITQLIGNLTASFGQDVANLATDDVLDADEWPLAMRVELPNCCDLCAVISGRIIRRDDPRFRLYARQVHMNCKGYWSYINRAEGHEEAGPDGKAVWVPTRPDWPEIPDELVRKHGHFVRDPQKYAPLNIPGSPTGRQMIVVPRGLGVPAQIRFAPNLPQSQLLRLVSQVCSAVSDAVDAPVISRAATLRQCADQVAQRAEADPAPYTTGFAHDLAEYGEGLTETQFARLPLQVLRGRDLSSAQAVLTGGAGGGSRRAIVFRAAVDGVERACALELRTGKLTYVNVPPALLPRLPKFAPIGGTW